MPSTSELYDHAVTGWPRSSHSGAGFAHIGVNPSLTIAAMTAHAISRVPPPRGWEPTARQPAPQARPGSSVG